MAAVDYFSSESVSADLKKRTVRAGVWTAAAQLATVSIGIGSQPVLARLLDPEDFGLLAMVTVFTNFGLLFVHAGLAMATVQRPEITRQQVSNLFWAAVLLGCVIAGLVACLAPGIAYFYSEPKLIGITLASTSVYVFSGLAIQHLALLRRGMQFRVIALIQVASVFAAQGIAICWAWNRRGEANDYWALVSLPITASMVTMIGAWAACGWRPWLPRRGSGTKSMINFGANLTGSNLMNYFSRNTDKLLIGWWSGSVQLGFYERAYRLLLFPLQNVNAPLSSVVTPALSRVAHNEELFLSSYLRVLRLLLWTLVAALVALACTAEWWVVLILSERYAESAPIFGWLAITGILQPISNSVSWLYVAKDKSAALMKWSMMATPLTLIPFVAGLPWGAVGVAALYALSDVFVRFPLMWWWFHRNRVADTRRVLAELAGVAPLLGVIAIANLTLTWALPDLHPGAGVALCIGVTVLVWVPMLFLASYGRALIDDVRWMLGAKAPSPEAGPT